MRRREFITLLSCAATAWPRVAGAQQLTMPLIGFLSGRARGEATEVLAAFHSGLNATGYVEGRNVAIEYRWADRQYDRLPDMAVELIRRQVAVIVATGGDISPMAAKAATATIPIVFLTGRDPVELGLVASINRPGSNLTGATLMALDLEGKRLGLLRELIPGAAIFAVLLNPKSTLFDAQLKAVNDAARAAGQKIEVLNASTTLELDAAFAAAAGMRADAMLVGTDPFLNGQQKQLVALASSYSLPTISSFREFATLGGLMTYGATFSEAYRQAGILTGRILKGEKPGDLPVLQPTKFELVINLKTAKRLGLKVPFGLLSNADEVLE